MDKDGNVVAPVVLERKSIIIEWMSCVKDEDQCIEAGVEGSKEEKTSAARR